MSWSSKLKKAAKKVKKAVNKAAEKVADAIETAGNKVEEAANKLGNDIRDNVPIIGPALGAVVRWAGAVVSGVADLAGAAVKAVGSAVGGLLAGSLLILGGMIKDGILTVLSGSVGGALLVLGKFVSLIQIAFGAESRKRRLTEKEAEMLRNIFRDSVALFNIRIIEGNSGVFDFNDRRFTMCNTIYMKHTPAAEWDSTLVHETTHVWQYQNVGSSYSSDALGAQLYYEYVKDKSAYAWWDATVNNVSTVWEEWNREAAAQFVENLYNCGEASTLGQSWERGGGRFYGANGTSIVGQFWFNGTNITKQDPCGTDRTDYTFRADQAVLAIRAEVSVRASSTIM